MNLGNEVTVTAHRGAALVAPENTLAAFQAAIEAGADAIEFDVRLSADGAVVVFHDSDFRRIAGDPREVVDTPLSAMRGIDIGSWFDPAFAGERIATLGEALAFIDRRALALVELKPDAHNAQALLDASLREVRAGGYQDVVMLASLSPELVRRGPCGRTAGGLALFASADLPGTARRTGFDMLGLHHPRIDTAAVRDARRAATGCRPGPSTTPCAWPATWTWASTTSAPTPGRGRAPARRTRRADRCRTAAGTPAQLVPALTGSHDPALWRMR